MTQTADASHWLPPLLLLIFITTTYVACVETGAAFATNVNQQQQHDEHHITFNASINVYKKTVPLVSFGKRTRDLATLKPLEEETAAESRGVARAPPVYASAPKYILFGGQQQTGAPARSDLSTAAGHKKKKKVKKIKKVKKVTKKKKKVTKKKKKVAKKKKLKKVKVKKVFATTKKKPSNAIKKKEEPKKKIIKIVKIVLGQPRELRGNFYENRQVPAKDAWTFDFKRGNDKHTIERHEEVHKSQFKVQVKWRDTQAKGKGHHTFDYNHRAAA